MFCLVYNPFTMGHVSEASTPNCDCLSVVKACGEDLHGMPMHGIVVENCLAKQLWPCGADVV